MDKPTVIRLLGVDIQIEFCKNEDGGDISKDVYGEWDSDTSEIKIHSDLPDHHKKITLLHELLHGVDEFLGLGLPHKTVYAISQSLYAVMKDNRKMIEWIMEDDSSLSERLID
jgi:hypothetical protein